MFDLFKTKPLSDGFYQQNKIAADKEHLLNIGAMLLEYNQYRDSLTLKSRLHTNQLEPLLNSAWGIYDKPSCLELLDELLQVPNQYGITIMSMRFCCKEKMLTSSPMKYWSSPQIFTGVSNTTASLYLKRIALLSTAYNLMASAMYRPGILSGRDL